MFGKVFVCSFKSLFFRLQDIDGNGSVNLIRDSKTSPYGEGPIFDWEWNGSKFIAQF